MNILGGSVVWHRQLTATYLNQFLDTEPEWTTRLTAIVTWNSVAMSCSPRAQTTFWSHRRDTHGCHMPNGSDFALFWQWGLSWIPMHGGKMKHWEFVVVVILEIKSPLSVVCYLSSEGQNSLFKHLDLTLAPKKTTEGAKKAKKHPVTW